MNMEDNLLAKRILAGDREAFKVLYEEFFHTLLSVACKYVEREEAGDMVQDAFLKLWSNPQKFERVIDLRFYLYRSVQNLCLNYIRGKKVEKCYRDKADLVTEDFFYHVVLEEEVFIRLRKAVKGLPDKYREVIDLTLEGLSDKDIADRLAVSVDVVKTRKKRGKDQLRQTLDGSFLILLTNFI